MQRLHRKRSARSGFSLVDICVALVILAVALGTLIGTVFHALRLEQSNEETAAASQMIRATLERIQATAFEDIYATYNDTPDDDPVPGADPFAALLSDDPLLTLGKKDGAVVTVLFPGAGSGQLREDEVDVAMGMPRDLNGDGAIDADDHGGDYTLLPLTLRLEWDGSAGSRSLEMSTILRPR